MPSLRALAAAVVVLYALAAASVLTGCAQLAGTQVVAPQTAQQGIAYGYAQLAAAYGLLADLAERGRITRDDGRRYLARLDETRTLLDAAAAAGDARGIQSVTAALVAIETDLKARSTR